MRKSPIKKVKKAWSFGRENAMKEESLSKKFTDFDESSSFWSG